jgi:hypothetical protein
MGRNISQEHTSEYASEQRKEIRVGGNQKESIGKRDWNFASRHWAISTRVASSTDSSNTHSRSSIFGPKEHIDDTVACVTTCMAHAVSDPTTDPRHIQADMGHSSLVECYGTRIACPSVE